MTDIIPPSPLVRRICVVVLTIVVLVLVLYAFGIFSM